MVEKVLYGLAKGDTQDWQKVVLIENATQEQIDRVIPLAKEKGYHSFSVKEITLDKPNFINTIN